MARERNSFVGIDRGFAFDGVRFLPVLLFFVAASFFSGANAVGQIESTTSTDHLDDLYLSRSSVAVEVNADLTQYKFRIQTTDRHEWVQGRVYLVRNGVSTKIDNVQFDNGGNSSGFVYYNELSGNDERYRWFSVSSGGWTELQVNLIGVYDWLNTWQAGDQIRIQIWSYDANTNNNGTYNYYSVIEDPNPPDPEPDPNWCDVDQTIPKATYALTQSATFGSLTYTGTTAGGSLHRYSITVTSPLHIRSVLFMGGTGSGIHDIEWTISTGESGQTNQALGTVTIPPRAFSGCVAYPVIDQDAVVTFFFSVPDTVVTDPATGGGFGFVLTAPFAVCDANQDGEYQYECDGSVGNTFTHDGTDGDAGYPSTCDDCDCINTAIADLINANTLDIDRLILNDNAILQAWIDYESVADAAEVAQWRAMMPADEENFDQVDWRNKWEEVPEFVPDEDGVLQPEMDNDIDFGDLNQAQFFPEPIDPNQGWMQTYNEIDLTDNVEGDSAVLGQWVFNPGINEMYPYVRLTGLDGPYSVSLNVADYVDGPMGGIVSFLLTHREVIRQLFLFFGTLTIVRWTIETLDGK